MNEKTKEILFGLTALGVFTSNLGIFIIIKITGAAFVYENNQWILYTELGLSALFTLWAAERLIKDVRSK